MSTTNNRHPYPRRSSPPHGFGDDERSRFIRKRPPGATLRWVEQNCGAPVRRVEARRGGSSSAIHELRLGDTRLILRRYVRLEVIEEEPDIIDQEIRALEALRRSDAATPTPVLADETGAEADVPALVMTCLPGRVNWTPRELDPWLRELAEALVPVHNTAWTAADGIRPFKPYPPGRWEPPRWLRDRSIWDRAVEVFHAPPVDDSQVLINRDYHPGNVLFRKGRVSGVVDWQSAAIGSPSVDIAHCRGNLIARFGLAAADRFTQLWENASGQSYHPWAESAMALDALGWPGRSAGPAYERRDMETSISRALSELGV